MAFLPDSRILVIEKNTARVRLVIGNAISSTDPVLLVPNVQGAGSEQGLLGIAVDPGWPARPYVYLQYTSTLDPHIRISRFTVSGDLSFTGNGALTADPASRYDVISDIVDNYVFHNGGGLRFGTDGMLYSALGEDLEACYAQLLTTLYGKILRLDVSGLPPGPGGPPPYSAITPPGNPFVAHPDIRAHLIWAYGVRNPYSFDVDPSNGDLMIADVGEVKQEELSWATGPGMNFGWPVREGYVPGPSVLSCAGLDTTGFTRPVYAYPHDDEFGSAVISMGFYRRPPGAATGFPAEYEGDFFFTDVGPGWIRRLKRDGASWSLAPLVPGQPSLERWGHQPEGRITFGGVGSDGALYYVFYHPAGQIRRIVHHDPLVGVGGGPRPGTLLEAPRPVPARGHVRLAYTLETAGEVELAVYDAAGRHVRRLADGVEPAGRREVRWDGRDDAGREVEAGLYFARLRAQGGVSTRRIPLLR